MKQFQLKAKPSIGYLRWMRPGSIIGPQQQFLQENETRLWRMGKMMPAKATATGAFPDNP